MKKATKPGAKKRKPAPNRQVKSYMFATLFNNVEAIISLVNAVLGTRFAPDTPAEIATLKNVLKSGPLNDLAIILEDTLLVMVEHQSTDNPNMAYRMLEYVTEIYKRRVPDRNRYSRRRIILPRPVFVVLYNGQKVLPARQIQRLSNSFTKALPYFTDLGCMELEVTIVNMNDPSNKSMIKTCELLHEYSIFIDKVVTYSRTMTAEKALIKAVAYCEARGILKDFLRVHKKELIMGTMLVKDWDWEMAVEVANQEGFEDGMEAGLKKGEKRGEARGVKKGMEKGMEKVVKLIERGVSLDRIKKTMLKTAATPKKRPATPRAR